ncbi:MAG: DUF2283 domain-containing protein [Thermodesulfobacterium sp.]|nr:DUF2283 domain-containing protein [Thermodesulfobacterium sp.]
MKIKYSKDSDILIITLKEGTPEDSIDLKEGVILHLDKEGKPLELEILDASQFVQLEEISFSTSITSSEKIAGF